MGTTKPKQTISTTLTLVEKQALDKIATEWGLKAGVVLRRLVLFLLQNRISFIEILQNPVRGESESESFISIEVLLSINEKQEIIRIAKEWDFTVSAVLRRLVRALLFGGIPKNKLWN